MRRIHYLVICLLIIAFSAIAFVAGAAAQTSDYTGQKWEYMTVRVSVKSEGGYTFAASTAGKHESESLTDMMSQFGDSTSDQALPGALNYAGSQGWELISPIPLGGTDFLLTFKRTAQ